MSKPLQLGVIALVGLVSARLYAEWLLASGAHKDALHSSGVAGYWPALGGPAILLFGAYLFALARPSFKLWALPVIGAAVAALATWFLGFFGSYLLCVFITRGVCE